MDTVLTILCLELELFYKERGFFNFQFAQRKFIERYWLIREMGKFRKFPWLFMNTFTVWSKYIIHQVLCFDFLHLKNANGFWNWKLKNIVSSQNNSKFEQRIVKTCVNGGSAIITIQLLYIHTTDSPVLLSATEPKIAVHLCETRALCVDQKWNHSEYYTGVCSMPHAVLPVPEQPDGRTTTWCCCQVYERESGNTTATIRHHSITTQHNS